MRIDIKKINIILARKKMTKKQLAEVYGVSSPRIYFILRQRDKAEVTNVCAGRMADALGVDLTDILED